MRRYKENKEKLRRRKEEAKKRKMTTINTTAPPSTNEPFLRKLKKLTEGLPVVTSSVDDDAEAEENGHKNSIQVDNISSAEMDPVKPCTSKQAAKYKIINDLEESKKQTTAISMSAADVASKTKLDASKS